ncbi:hypothetical protein B0T24DRAFT_172009 [Lasiosphaeria ovina]|uniref:Uncharacterized protein n=1 Tax=Lasiosphaeria ovina TaxID=92902 RepID=A0AAE0NE61_9PEZI|nr:hypothetical protein B0T24DRAFT_172009 [Lasiosphaeria ovina]
MQCQHSVDSQQNAMGCSQNQNQQVCGGGGTGSGVPYIARENHFSPGAFAMRKHAWVHPPNGVGAVRLSCILACFGAQGVPTLKIFSRARTLVSLTGTTPGHPVIVCPVGGPLWRSLAHNIHTRLLGAVNTCRSLPTVHRTLEMFAGPTVNKTVDYDTRPDLACTNLCPNTVPPLLPSKGGSARRIMDAITPAIAIATYRASPPTTVVPCAAGL